MHQDPARARAPVRLGLSALLLAGLLLLTAPAAAEYEGRYAFPGDWNGDGVWDLAIVVQDGNAWIWAIQTHRPTHTGLVDPQFIFWGCVSCGDEPVPADYDGDGALDVAVYRESTGEWFIRKSSDGSLMYVYWGSPANGDFPVPFDYDGDHKTDIAIYRPAGQLWYIRRSSDGALWLCGYQVCQ